MKTRFITLLALVLLIHLDSKACDCVPYEGDFCSSISTEQGGQIIDYLSIFHIKVVTIEPDGMMAQVLQTFHGSEKSSQEIFIQKGNGADCKVITDIFELEEELIVSLQEIDDGWMISDCGVHYLKVLDNLVSGPITSNVTELNLSQFSSLDPTCGKFIVTAVHEPLRQMETNAHPNPTMNKISLTISGNLSELVQITIMDVFGRLAQQIERRIEHGQPITIEMEDWDAGVYLFLVKTRNNYGTIKVVKIEG